MFEVVLLIGFFCVGFCHLLPAEEGEEPLREEEPPARRRRDRRGTGSTRPCGYAWARRTAKSATPTGRPKKKPCM